MMRKRTTQALNTVRNLLARAGQTARGRRRWLVLGLAASAALVGTAAARPDDRDFGACAGTYLIDEGSTSLDLWTFHRDGTLVNTSLGEQIFNFSTQHGSWKTVGPLSAQAIQLDLHLAEDGGFASIGRVDINIHAVGRNCDQVAGDFSVRLFEAGEDPFDPSTDSGEPFTDTFTGRRVE
jgi:hypothetical protein